jgi:hypothetical protein
MPAPQTIPAARLRAGDFVSACDRTDLIYFLVNVGDGDTQLLLLPAASDGTRRAIVVDIATKRKLPDLVEKLAAVGLMPERSDVFALVVATHPHSDHISGMAEFLDRFHELVWEFWEPGFYHPSPSYIEMMRVLEDRDILQSQPTAGMSRFIGNVRVQVLAPDIGLRNRFDTYGVDINNASIALKIEFPATRVAEGDADRRYLPLRGRTQGLILGGDAQTAAWSHVLVDFPELHPEGSPVSRALRIALGGNPLAAHVFKVPHHGSKHGVNLELTELIRPRLSLFSSVGGRGNYGFPHWIAQEAVREAVEATTSGQVRSDDCDLGLHYTSGTDDAGQALGTIGLVLSPSGRKRQIWRFGDRSGQLVNLQAARFFQ